MRTTFSILALLILSFGVGLSSCSNASKSSNKQMEYKPSILSSDMIIKCYHLGGIAEDIVTGTYRAIPLGNILLSQNGIIKALQIQYADGEIKWHEVTYFSIDDSYQQYKCEKTGKVFSHCAEIVYIDLEAKALGWDSNKKDRIYWN